MSSNPPKNAAKRALEDALRFKSGSRFDVVALQICRHVNVEYYVYGNGPCVAAVPVRNDDVKSAAVSELMVFYSNGSLVENIAVIESHGVVIATSGNLYSIFRFDELLNGGFLCTSRVYHSPDTNPFVCIFPSLFAAVSMASKSAILTLCPSVKRDHILLSLPFYRGEHPDENETRILMDTRISFKNLADFTAKSGLQKKFSFSHVDYTLENHKFVSRVANVKDFLELLGVNVVLSTDGSLHVGWHMENTEEECLRMLVKKGIRQLRHFGPVCFLTGDEKGFITVWRISHREGACVLGKLHVPFGSISSAYMVEEKHLLVGSSMGGIARYNNIIKWPTIEESPAFSGQQKLPTFIRSFHVCLSELYAILDNGSIWIVRGSSIKEVTPSSEQGFRQMSYANNGVLEGDIIACAHNGCFVWYMKQWWPSFMPPFLPHLPKTPVFGVVKIASGCENCESCKQLPPIRAVFPLECGVLLENIGELSLWTYEGSLLKFLSLPEKSEKFRCTSAVVVSNSDRSDSCLILGGANGELMFADLESECSQELQEARIPCVLESGRIADITNHSAENVSYILSGRRTLCISIVKVLAFVLGKTVLKLDFMRFDYIHIEKKLRPGKFHWNSGKLYVSAFSKGDFLLFNVENRAAVLRIPCGSANIHWQFHFGENSYGELYMLKKGLVVCKKQKITEPKFLHVPIHSAPITCVVVILKTDYEVFLATAAANGMVAVSRYTLQTRTWTRECSFSTCYGSVTCLDVTPPVNAEDRYRMLAFGTSQGYIRIDLLDIREVDGRRATVTNSLCFYNNNFTGHKVECVQYWADDCEGFMALYKDFAVKMVMEDHRWTVQHIVGFGFPLHSVFLGMTSLGLERCRRSMYAYGATKDVHVYADISTLKKHTGKSFKLTSYKGKFEVLDEPVTHLKMIMLTLTTSLADCWLAGGRSGKIRLTLKKSFQEKEPLYFLEINHHKTPIKGLDAPYVDPARAFDINKAHVVSLSADGCVAVNKVFFGHKKTLCEISLLASCVTSVPSPRAMEVLPHRWGQYLIVGDSLEIVRLREKDPKEMKREKKSSKQSKA